jgi:hypothetical protein
LKFDNHCVKDYFNQNAFRDNLSLKYVEVLDSQQKDGAQKAEAKNISLETFFTQNGSLFLNVFGRMDTKIAFFLTSPLVNC